MFRHYGAVLLIQQITHDGVFKVFYPPYYAKWPHPRRVPAKYVPTKHITNIGYTL